MSAYSRSKQLSDLGKKQRDQTKQKDKQAQLKNNTSQPRPTTSQYTEVNEHPVNTEQKEKPVNTEQKEKPGQTSNYQMLGEDEEEDEDDDDPWGKNMNPPPVGTQKSLENSTPAPNIKIENELRDQTIRNERKNKCIEMCNDPNIKSTGWFDSFMSLFITRGGRKNNNNTFKNSKKRNNTL